MSETGCIFAIVPAAGRSRRMGTTKALLPIGSRPMLLGVLDALRAGGAHRITLVSSPELRAALPDLPPDVHLIINHDPDTQMIDSIRLGLRAALETSMLSSTGAAPVPVPSARASRPCRWDGVLVCPCDAAGITADDVRQCIQAFHQTPDRIIIAAHNNRRGHPILFPAPLAAAVLSSECNQGLNHLSRNRPHLVRLIECSSGTTSNINTPNDYASGTTNDDTPNV